MNEPNGHIPQVYACIAAVSAEIAQSGISKDRTNAQQGYKFRGIDDVYNALAPVLAKHRLVILPRILSRSVAERETKNGGTLSYVTVEAEFDFVCATDASLHTARTFGEAMDSADKATNKAMSAAYKYVTFQAFCIPTEGDNDADAHTPEARSAQPPQPQKPAPAQSQSQRPQRPVQVPTTPPDSRDGVRVMSTKEAKKGTSNKGPWVLYAVKFSDGREGKTFSKSVYKAAQEAHTTQSVVDVDLDEKGGIVQLLPVRQLEEAPF